MAATLASAMGFIDGTVVAITLPAMRETLGASLSQAQWISNAYLLTLSALILVGGALGDRFGLSRVFPAAIAGFVATSLLCAIAPGPDFLIVARALQGVCAAAMIPGSLAIISKTYPSAERGRAIGIWASASAITTALGPIIGGLAVDRFGPEAWRAIFAVNLPLGAIAVWLLVVKTGRDGSNSDQPLDLTGAALATLGLGLLAVGLTGAEHGEAIGARGAAIFAAGLVVLWAFVVFETRTANPMIPVSIFRNRAFSAANVATFFLYFGMSAVLFFLPMTLITGWGEPAWTVSLAFAPLSILIAVFSTSVGKAADRIGPAPLIASGSVVAAVAFAGLAVLAPQHLFWTGVMPLMTLMAVGFALVVAPLSVSVMSSVGDELAGVASGINNGVSRVAGLVAVALLGSVAGAVYAGTGGPGSFGAPGSGAIHVAATDAAFSTIAWTAAGTALLSAVVSAIGISRP